MRTHTIRRTKAADRRWLDAVRSGSGLHQRRNTDPRGNGLVVVTRLSFLQRTWRVALHLRRLHVSHGSKTNEENGELRGAFPCPDFGVCGSGRSYTGYVELE